MANEQCWAKCGGTLRILCHRLLCNPPESVFCCAIHPKATHIATGGEDDRLVVRDTTNFEVVYLEAAFKDSVDQAAFSGKDGAFLAAADMSGVIKVWNVASKAVAWEFETSDIKVGEFRCRRVNRLLSKVPFLQSTFWHPSSNILFATTVDSELWMWKIPSGESKIYAGMHYAEETGGRST